MNVKILSDGRWKRLLTSVWLPAVVLLLLYIRGFRFLLTLESAARSYAVGLMVGVGIVLVLTLWLWYGTKLSKGAKYALTAFLMGLMMLLCLTPLAAPDEQTHYENTLKVLSVFFGREYSAALFDFSGLAGHFSVSTGYVRVARDLPGLLPAGTETRLVTGTVAYVPEYIPQTVGVALGLLTRCNAVTTILLGRLTNLMFYVFCFYTAIRRMPGYRDAMGLAGLLPMAVQQAASLSYDSFIIGLSFVYLASVLYSAGQKGPVTRKELAWIGLSGVLLAPTRAVYAALALLFFLVPRRRFPSACRRYLAFALLLGACLVLTFGSQMDTITTLGEETGEALNWEGQKNYTVAYILSDPLDTVKLFLRTFLDWGDNWFAEAHGSTLAGLSLPMHRWIPAGLILLMLLSVTDGDSRGLSVSGRARILLFVVICAAMGGMMLAMMLAWTSVSRNTIQGVQGRYFLPVLVPFYLILSSPRPLLKGKTRAFLIPGFLILMKETLCQIIYYTMTH